MLTGFFIRLNNFVKSDMRTIDEVVYYRMAKQINVNFFDYNTIPYGQELSSRGRDLPKYFFEPLFKHPPVFTYLTAVAMKFFGNNMPTSVYISLLMGLLMIPLVYLLGKIAYGFEVGILSAFFMWLDPITTICSQKVWMDTTIAFFTLTSALFFVLALKNKWDFGFILSGIASGLAVNTKYSGLIITFAIITFSLIYRRDLFKNKHFISSLFLPIIMLIPWVVWNYKVYGINSISKHEEIMIFSRMISSKIWLLILLIGIITIYYFTRRVKAKNKTLTQPTANNSAQSKWTFIFSLGFVTFFFTFLLREQLFYSLNLISLPRSSWAQGFFSHETPIFYFGQLIEFSPFFIFGIAMLLLFHPNEKEESSFIRLTALIILLFFILWGNFQSRYILSSIPFLVVLSCAAFAGLLRKAENIKTCLLRSFLQLALTLCIIYAISKIFFVNYFLSYTNNACYF